MYKMIILTKKGECPFMINQMGFQAWHSIFGVVGHGIISNLENKATFNKLCTTMINNDFVAQFYQILDDNRIMADDITELLKLTLYAIHYETYTDQDMFKSPLPLFIEGKIDNEGDYIKYSYIDSKKWNYDYVYKTLYSNTSQVTQKTHKSTASTTESKSNTNSQSNTTQNDTTTITINPIGEKTN